jgi:hypothetical protein
VAEPVCRVYCCRRCGIAVCVCPECDDGQVFCAGECAISARRESVRRAGARYQKTRRGAHRHAARQRRWRQQQQQRPLLQTSKIVTHHACSTSTTECTVSPEPQTGKQVNGDAHENAHNEAVGSSDLGSTAVVFTERCDFCRARKSREGRDSPSGSVTDHGAGVASAAAALRGSA